MDYAKFDKVKEDGSGVHDRETTALSKKPTWALLVEKKEVAKLQALVQSGELPLDTVWSGERHRWQTPGNFADENEVGSYTVLGYAVCWNKPEVVQMLLECGADATVPVTVNRVERTLLSVAQGRNHKKIVALLKAALAK